jgi:hypothetical protein
VINLYRGIIDIFTRQARTLEDKMTGHIRGSFDYNPEDNAFGSAGFWNLQAEICFILFVKLFVVIGIVSTIVLAFIFFPLHAIKTAFMKMFSSMHTHQFITEETIRKEPK